ncbi:surface-adhesin E family protein [Chromobacterium sp. CV08]|uniref:surface-adhesin E family protein n=1 Tax=Chromobacterium sp. CV08 TaxID=3133274 RepID=UPI003DA855D9
MRIHPLSLLALLLAGCAATPRPAAPTQPVAPVAPQAAPASADWQNLGVSPNGNILNELDLLSIKRQGSLTTFRDRKTIFNLKKENFLTTPRHKVSLNTWQIDCAQHTFRLLDMTLFDENGRQIAGFTYNDNQIKSMPVVQHSASYQQMLLVCKGQPGF